jgi:hypothetical protein
MDHKDLGVRDKPYIEMRGIVKDIQTVPRRLGELILLYIEERS